MICNKMKLICNKNSWYYNENKYFYDENKYFYNNDANINKNCKFLLIYHKIFYYCRARTTTKYCGSTRTLLIVNH